MVTCAQNSEHYQKLCHYILKLSDPFRTPHRCTPSTPVPLTLLTPPFTPIPHTFKRVKADIEVGRIEEGSGGSWLCTVGPGCKEFEYFC
jgi:hypothetical protein